MRILDVDKDCSLARVLMLLTRAEALELRGTLDHLLADPHNNHEHVSDETYQKEITIALYGQDIQNQFDERSTRLVELDK